MFSNSVEDNSAEVFYTSCPEPLPIDKTVNIKEVQDATYEAMLSVLEKYKLCNVERPTGFGKTNLFMRYAREHAEQKMLYVYDTNAVLSKIQNDYDTRNVDFVSYASLSRESSYQENILNIVDGNYAIVVFDESHLLGGENISKVADTVIPYLVEKGCYVLGGTATAIRTDLVDVTSRFFNNHTVYDYTLVDAFNDGLIEAPMYTVMLHSKERIKEDLKKNRFNRYTVKRLKQLEYAYAKRAGAASIYRDKIIKLYGEVPSYMKFIVFYPTIQSMKDNKNNLVNDFKAAFPERDIIVCPVSSDVEHFNNYKQLNTDECPDNKIELVTCVDMLNQGYHSTTLTGIIMNRTTMSNIIYTQQLGRCLSVMSKQRTIVFDNVANCNIDPLESLAAIQDMQSDEHRGDSTGRVRGFLRLNLVVDAEELAIAEWYSRIRSTQDVTQADVDYAKRLYTRDMAHADFIEKNHKVPAWLLKEELEAEGKWEG